MDGEVTGVTIQEEEGDILRITLTGPQRLFVVVLRTPIEKRPMEQTALPEGWKGTVYSSGKNGLDLAFNEGETQAKIDAYDKKDEKYFNIPVPLAKQLKKHLMKHTLQTRQVAEFIVAPRIGVGVEGPARQTGQLPRDPTFEPLFPQGVGSYIAKYLGGKTRNQKKKTSRRRKTTRLENVSRKK